MSMLGWLIEHIKMLVDYLDHLENLVVLTEITIKVHKLLSDSCRISYKTIHLLINVLTDTHINHELSKSLGYMTHMNM